MAHEEGEEGEGEEDEDGEGEEGEDLEADLKANESFFCE